MQLSVSVGIIGTTGLADDAPLRLARMADIDRLAGEGWAARSPALVATALALIESVPRVVVAPSVAALPSEITLVACVGQLEPAYRDSLRAPPGGTLLLDLTEDVSAGEAIAARRRGVRFVWGGGNFLLPGARFASRVEGAALALPLVFGRPMLGPLVDLIPAPLATELRGTGVLVLETYTPKRSAPRVVLPVTERARAEVASETIPSEPNARLEAALRELSERFTHRLGRDPGAIATLKREADRLFQAEVASGAIKGYALAIEPIGDDLSIEVVITVPKRVGQVIIRVSQASPRSD